MDRAAPTKGLASHTSMLLKSQDGSVCSLFSREIVVESFARLQLNISVKCPAAGQFAARAVDQGTPRVSSDPACSRRAHSARLLIIWLLRSSLKEGRKPSADASREGPGGARDIEHAPSMFLTPNRISAEFKATELMRSPGPTRQISG